MLSWAIFSSQCHFKIKLNFVLGGMVVGSTSEILVEDDLPGIKEVWNVSEFRSFQCNHNIYGLCLGLVLSRKPHRSTNIWRFLARLDPAGRGDTKGKPRHGLVCKRTWSWIVGKVHKLSIVLQSDRSAVFTETEQHWASEGWSQRIFLSFLNKVLKPHGGSNIANGWDFGTWRVISKCLVVWTLGEKYPHVPFDLFYLSKCLQSRVKALPLFLLLRENRLYANELQSLDNLACRVSLILSLV